MLVSPEGERKMVSLGAGRNWVVDGRLLANSQGTVLIHMQSKLFFVLRSNWSRLVLILLDRRKEIV